MHRSLRNLLFTAAALFAAAGASAEVLQEITVKEGDTLWGVANYYLKDPKRWPDILEYNKLPSANINVILPGMRLRVPMLLIKEHLRAAHLINILNDVLFRRKSEAEWRKARLDMELYNEDGLRTLRQSSAKVKFPSGELLHLDENSLIILKPEKKREEIDLLSGGVRASRTKILTSSSLVDPKIEPRGANPDFKTKVKEDKTTLVEVYEGIVDVTAQGTTVTLTKGFGTEVKFSQPPSLPKALPPQPELGVQTPTDMPGTKLAASGTLSTGMLQIDIRPNDASGVKVPPSSSPPTQGQSQILGHIINNYHLQISTNHAFTALVLDEVKPVKDTLDVDFKRLRLPDGIYYYRLAYMDELGFEGQFSFPVQFTVDTVPPPLVIDVPRDEEEVDGEFIHIEGSSEPGATLTVNDKSFQAEETGKFNTAITPKEGRNLIRVSARDRAGNSTKKELTVHKVKNAAKANRSSRIEHEQKEKSLTLASLALGTLTALVIIGVLIVIVR